MPHEADSLSAKSGPLWSDAGKKLTTTLEYLVSVRERRGACYLPLLDPDRLSLKDLEARAELCVDVGADAILVGTSLML